MFATRLELPQTLRTVNEMLASKAAVPKHVRARSSHGDVSSPRESQCDIVQGLVWNFAGLGPSET